MVSQKKEDISHSDTGYKHDKPAEVSRFCLFMKHCCNIIQSDEEQNPLAVMRWPGNGSFLLEQIKNWIANKSSGFNALKIISSLCQEPIYRSPGAGQQMAGIRYSISIHIENRDAFYQGDSKSQMLLWDAHAPPPKRVTSSGDWYIVSMEVFVQKVDLGGQRLDNRNPEVHVKVTLHVANGRMAWTPPGFSPCDAHLQAETYMYNNGFSPCDAHLQAEMYMYNNALNPCFLNNHAYYTLSPEEFCQLVGPQKYFLLTEQPKAPIPTLNPCFLNNHAYYTLSPEEFCQLFGPPKYFLCTKQLKAPIPTLNPCFLNNHAYYTLSPEEFCQLVGPEKYFLPTEQPKAPSTLNPCFLNNHVYYTLSPEEFCQIVGPPKYFLPTKQLKAPIPTLNPCVLNNHAYNTLSPEEFCQLVGPEKYFLCTEQPKAPIPKDTSILDPGPPKLNHAIYMDRRNMNASRLSYKSGDSVFSIFKTLCILLLIAKAPTAAANPIPQTNQVELEILQGADNQNCTLKMDEYSLCYGHCGQNKKRHQKLLNASVRNLVVEFCEHQQNGMHTNLQSSNYSSGTLQLILIWSLNKDFNATKVTIQYMFNGKELTEEEMANLPMTISGLGMNDIHLNSSVFMEKMKDYAKMLWGHFREELLPFLQKSDLPETTTSSPTTEDTTSTTEPPASWEIAISTAIPVIGILIPIAIGIVYGNYGKKTCKRVRETISKVFPGLAAQTEAEAEGGPNRMEAPESEDLMTNPV